MAIATSLAIAAAGMTYQVDQSQKASDRADKAAKVQKEQQDKLNRDMQDKMRQEEDQAAKDAARNAQKRAGGGYAANPSRGGTVLTSPLGVTGGAPTGGGSTILGG